MVAILRIMDHGRAIPCMMDNQGKNCVIHENYVKKGNFSRKISNLSKITGRKTRKKN